MEGEGGAGERGVIVKAFFKNCRNRSANAPSCSRFCNSGEFSDAIAACISGGFDAQIRVVSVVEIPNGI